MDVHLSNLPPTIALQVLRKRLKIFVVGKQGNRRRAIHPLQKAFLIPSSHAKSELFALIPEYFEGKNVTTTAQSVGIILIILLSLVGLISLLFIFSDHDLPSSLSTIGVN